MNRDKYMVFESVLRENKISDFFEFCSTRSQYIKEGNAIVAEYSIFQMLDEYVQQKLSSNS